MDTHPDCQPLLAFIYCKWDNPLPLPQPHIQHAHQPWGPTHFFLLYIDNRTTKPPLFCDFMARSHFS